LTSDARPWEVDSEVTGQFTDKLSHSQLSQASRGLVYSQTSQLPETYDLKFAINIAINVTYSKLHN